MRPVLKSAETIARVLLLRAQRIIDTSQKRSRAFSLFFASFLLLILVAYGMLIRPPAASPMGITISVPEGATLRDTAEIFREEHVIRSDFLLRAVVILLEGERSVVAGDYFFERPSNLFSVAFMLMRGDYGHVPVKITVLEGASNIDIAARFAEQFSLFDPQVFLELARGKEGYLFPDTYYFSPNVEEKTIIETLENTFKTKVALLEEEITQSGRTLEDIVIMASLIEREARTEESRRIISGILWRRVDIDMPLQVDVTFDYINGKTTAELTREDLKIDSPYNTYRYSGLPPGPITNPGLDALSAAVNPIETDYLYFLADRTGEVHYSVTFEEHREKKLQYLN